MASRGLKLLLLIAVLLACASPLAAQNEPAQPAATPTPTPAPATAGEAQPGEPTGETITVVGYSEALQAGVEVKRAAPAIVDAIVADDVGKLPDKNLAEAVQRVPGVVVNREFGEGERVSLRGVGPNLTRTSVNGHNVAVADWAHPVREHCRAMTRHARKTSRRRGGSPLLTDPIRRIHRRIGT